MRTKLSPLGALGRGFAAGAIGTAAMTAWQELSSRLQQSGGGEAGGAGGSQPQDPWEKASAPAQVGRRIVRGVFQRDPAPELIPVFTHGMHWAYGTGWGGAYGLIGGSIGDGDGPLRRGILLGTAVWTASYLQLVPMGLYQPPWKYPPKQLAMDLSYHIVYGAGTALGWRALDRG